MSAKVPDHWIPCDTILCKNGTHDSRCMYLGVFPFNPYGTEFVDDGNPVMVLLEFLGYCSWDHGAYMEREYHAYDPLVCRPWPPS